MSFSAKKISESNQQLIQKVRDGNKDAFEKLFYGYYHDLCSLAFKITRCSQQARDVVQNVFLKLWKKRRTWHITTSIKAYLYQAVWNEALNFEADKKRERFLKKEFAKTPGFHTESENPILGANTRRLIAEIWKIVDTLPQRRKFVFILHRKHGLTYAEIAKVMQISPKTVENHMGLALEEIRDKIDYRYLS
jgi:RNA polymerase sigma-70 factor (ECF subfamily)